MKAQFKVYSKGTDEFTGKTSIGLSRIAVDKDGTDDFGTTNVWGEIQINASAGTKPHEEFNTGDIIEVDFNVIKKAEEVETVSPIMQTATPSNASNESSESSEDEGGSETDKAAKSTRRPIVDEDDDDDEDTQLKKTAKAADTKKA